MLLGCLQTRQSSPALPTALPLGEPPNPAHPGPSAGLCCMGTGLNPARTGAAGAHAARYLRSALWVLVVAGEHFEGDGDAVGSAVGTEGVPHGPVHGVVHHVQAGEGDKRHGTAAQLHREVPLCRGHAALRQAACEAAGGQISARRLRGPGRPLFPGCGNSVPGPAGC